MTSQAPHAEHLSERIARRYAQFAGRRPFVTLAILMPLIGLCGWYGSSIQIRSNMEDLFPESTPAVVAAKKARDTLKSASQLTVVFGSPDREANRKLALAFCTEVAQWKEVSATECRRDIDFFRRNAALFLSHQELEDIDARVKKSIQEATEKEIVDDALTEGLDEPEAATTTGEPAAAGSAPGGVSGSGSGTGSDSGTGSGPGEGSDKAAAPNRFQLPTDEDLKKRFQAEDIREWSENPQGTVLGIKIFPTIAPSEIDQSAVFVAKLNALLDRLQPKAFHPEMTIAMSGDYAEMSEEIDNIRYGLYVTSGVALLVIALIQVLHFRRFRALILMSVPLVAGTFLTLAFARVSVGYLNMITAFIFSMLFGMGNDFNVYTLSRYLEERASGKAPLQAVEDTTAGLLRALNQAALTTSVAFFALTVLDFRGFSQFGLIAGVGVELALLSTMLLFAPLVMALNRIAPDRAVSTSQAEGQRWMGLFAKPAVARLLLAGTGVVAVAAFVTARDYEFETNLRKLRTVVSEKQQKSVSASKELEIKFRNTAEGRAGSPILVVTDSIDDAGAVHRQLERFKDKLTRVKYFVSIHTFVPPDQGEKMALIQRIRERIEAKVDVLEGKDKADAERALELLRAKPYGPNDLPDFVRKRFLDREDGLGRFVLIYAGGNLADAKSIQQVIDQVGVFKVGQRLYQSTASYFILAEADAIVKREGPLAVLLAAIAVFAVILWHFRNLRLVIYSFVPLTVSFVVFLGLAKALGLDLNLFSVTALPGILGIGIDGTTHILHRWWEDGPAADVRRILQQVGGAAWVALITTTVGFTALLFQDNLGLKSIAWMATVGLLTVCLLSNILAGAILTVFPPRRR